MASDMSGFAGAGGADKWMKASGGTMDDYNREMQGWQRQSQPQAQAPAQPAQGTYSQQSRQNAQQNAPQAPAQGGSSVNWNSQFAQQFDSSGRPVNLGNVDPSKVLAGTGASGYNAQDVTAYRNIDPNIVRNMTPEQRAVWSMQNIDDLSAHGDKERSYSQWMEWQKSYDSNCPPATPYQAEDGSGCVEKPDNSNKPGGGGAGGGGGQGGGGGYGGGAGGGGGFQNPIYQYLSSTGLQAAQDPEQALKNYMGWGGANQFQQQMDQARERVMAMPPGPARDAAAARLEEQKLTQLGGMRQAATGQARQELLNPIMGQEFGYGQLGENARQANMSNELGWGGLDLQRYLGDQSNALGWGNLGLGYSQLGENARQFGLDFGDRTGAGRTWQTQQAALDRDLQRYGIKENNKGKTTAAIAGAIGGILSDIRVKENIEELPSLSKLREIPVYSYNYTFEPERRRIGVMAQDVEKVAPELVDEGTDGLKRVDSYGLTALILSAVKELDDAN